MLTIHDISIANFQRLTSAEGKGEIVVWQRRREEEE
jgi:hypothetical protein